MCMNSSNKRVKQECSTCVHMPKCWPLATNSGKPVITANVVINILVCRLQMNIDVNRTTSLLLDIIRPGMLRLITHARQTGSIICMTVDELLTQMQTQSIYLLKYDYKIGDRGRATPYLFDIRQGLLVKWLKWVTSKNRHFYYRHELFSPVDDDDEQSQYHCDVQRTTQYSTQSRVNGTSWDALYQGSGHVRYDPYDPCNKEHHDEVTFVDKIKSIINDGVTLNSNEHRVLSFCMTNCNETNESRNIDGLHIYLSKIMNVSRPRVTRLFKRASDKIRRKYRATGDLS